MEKSTSGLIYLFDTTDMYKKRIILHADTYNNHILIRHPEMIDNVDAIKDVIENAKIIVRSNQNPNRLIYFGKSTLATYQSLNIKTVVDHSRPYLGVVTTSLFQGRLTPEKEGKVIHEET